MIGLLENHTKSTLGGMLTRNLALIAFLNRPAQRCYLDQMRSAALPPCVHPLQLADPITGAFSRAA